MKRIAIYGKGGIGKSTMGANVSAALALAGQSVVQIGCDPKHDSTRQLLGGTRITTVLDYLREARPDSYDIGAVLHEGFAGVGCVEAGGPKPGVGCAGRGIISTFDLLAQFRLEDHYDIALYDVLGDVVCGGFAVPIRREYADTILVVTSGEFMSLYAANNILRGIRNYDGDELRRVAGLVFNRRNVAGEEERVRRFARAVGLPVFLDVPRSDAFARAERAHATVMELGEDALLCELFSDAARRLVADDVPLHAANPLSDEDLETTVLGHYGCPATQPSSPGENGFVREEPPIPGVDGAAIDEPFSRGGNGRGSGPDVGAESVSSEERGGGSSAKAPASTAAIERTAAIDLTDPNRYLSKTLIAGEPLHGCAFNGAIAAALNVGDAVVVAHAPRSCANLSLATFNSTGRRALYERGELMPHSLAPNLECTDMDEPQIVFGGTDALLAKVREVKQRPLPGRGGQRPRAIVVISSCPAGIIGDDLDRVAELSDDACTVLPIKTDGNMTGDFLQGQLAAHLAIARTFIDRDVPLRPRTANIFAEKPAVTNTQRNFRVISEFLEQMGVSVNCRFLNSTTTEQLRGFCAGQLNIPAYGDYTAKLLGKLISEEFGGRVLGRGFPIGFDETVAWLEKVAEFFDARDAVPRIIAEQQTLYDAEIARLRPVLRGKKLMVITYNCELDWILRTALDLEMEIARIGILNYSQDAGFRTRIDADFPVVENYDRFDRANEIAKIAPDVLLTNYATAIADAVPVADTIPMCPDVGFMSSIALARRWARLLRLQLKGGWKNDGLLFEEAFL